METRLYWIPGQLYLIQVIITILVGDSGVRGSPPPQGSLTVWRAMPATAMFSNFKSRVGGGGAPQNLVDHNPIAQHFDVGKVAGSAGPELVWRVHDAYRKSDGKVSSSNK
ncbi:unnamed protein product [Nezara viridula]|uniref:Uncharacterized protein n=1 Tax=Nezara viridula TaxID=85310 RepID=A0A9P0MM66_NEZVI|nr:unnamed protein product [Nezara viridula]